MSINESLSMLWAGGQCRGGFGCGLFAQELGAGPNRHRRPAKQARRLAVPGGSCGGLSGVPSSPPPTACLRSVEERVRPPAFGAEGSWRRLCGGRNARIAAAHPHCTGRIALRKPLQLAQPPRALLLHRTERSQEEIVSKIGNQKRETSEAVKAAGRRLPWP